jgi:hypothetical protein
LRHGSEYSAGLQPAPSSPSRSWAVAALPCRLNIGIVKLAALLLALPLTLAAQAPPACPPQNSHIVIDSGTFSSQPGVLFRLKHFTATLVPMGKSAPLCYGKFTVLSRGEIYVSDESLTAVFAGKLGSSGSKIHDFKVVNAPDKVTLSGTITKVIPIAFSVSGPVTTDGAVLIVTATGIKADGIPVKALLGLIGEHLNSVFSMKGVTGVTVEDNTLRFAPEQIAHLKGHIQSVETTAGGIILRYGRAPAVHPSPPATHP